LAGLSVRLGRPPQISRNLYRVGRPVCAPSSAVVFSGAVCNIPLVRPHRPQFIHLDHTEGNMANNPLVGAWERVSDSSVGVLIYTGSHYAAVMAPKDRQRSSGERATPDEALEAIRSCQALSGTYTVSGSRITHVRVANTRADGAFGTSQCYRLHHSRGHHDRDQRQWSQDYRCC